MPKITKRHVDGLKPAAGQDVFLWDEGDGAIKGFGIRLKPSGVGSYLVQYRNQEGRTRRLVLGRVGVLTPDQAREMARDKIRAVSQGHDPSGERKAVRNSMSVAELCDLYTEEAAAWVKPSTLAVDKSRINAHVKPLLGNRAVTGLTRADIEKFQADIAVGKTAKARKATGRSGKVNGGKGVAARTVGMLGTILEYAKRKGLIKDNPTRGVRKFPDNKQRRFLASEEIKALGAAMAAAEANGESKVALSAIRCLLLTGCRRNEVLALPWDWVDGRQQCLRFGDSKSGAQLRPIGKAATQLLLSQPRDDDSAWVFPSVKDSRKHYVGLPAVLERLCDAASLEGVTLHVLRHTFAATAAEMGFSELTIAGLLGHSVPGVTARYAHVPDRVLVAAADKVSERVEQTLRGQSFGEIINLSTVDKRGHAL